jgi:hypothetical protein
MQILAKNCLFGVAQDLQHANIVLLQPLKHERWAIFHAGELQKHACSIYKLAKKQRIRSQKWAYGAHLSAPPVATAAFLLPAPQDAGVGLKAAKAVHRRAAIMRNAIRSGGQSACAAPCVLPPHHRSLGLTK